MERRSLLISVGLHVIIAVLASIGLPNLRRELPEEQPLVVMEVVQSVPTTNLTVGDKPSVAKEEQIPLTVKTPPPPKPRPSLPKPPQPRPPAPKPPPPKPPKPKISQPKPPAPKPPKPLRKAPDQKAEVIPEKIVEKPKPAVAQPIEPPKPKPKQTAAEKAPAKPPKTLPQQVNKLAQNQLKQKKQEQALSGVMQNLAKAKAALIEAEKKRAEEEKRRIEKEKERAEMEKQRRDKERKRAAENLADTLTEAVGEAIRAPKKAVIGPMGLSDIDRIRQQVSSCWSPPIGTAGAETLIVDIIVSLDRDGSVLTAEVENKARMSFDRTYRVAAEEALRTMSKCSPLPVPPDKYEQWKNFIFSFDPKFLTR
jgi:hypothetical protein